MCKFNMFITAVCVLFLIIIIIIIIIIILTRSFGVNIISGSPQHFIFLHQQN